jgi:uncharacterized protein YgbK (DUF1537 family)
MPPPLPQPVLAFYGDDFTGSTDALDFLARAGLRAVLFMEPPSAAELEIHRPLEAIGVAGCTRALRTEEIDAVLRPALDRLQQLEPRCLHYKICSTFDSSPRIGSIGRAIDVGCGLLRPAFVPLLVAAPLLGRHCVFGNLFARSGLDSEPFRLDRHPTMRRHPVTPMDESDLRAHLSKQTDRPVELFDILALAAPRAQAREKFSALLERSSRGAVILIDLLHERELAAAGELLWEFGAEGAPPLFAVGSSAVEMALAAYWLERGWIGEPRRFAAPGAKGPIAVVSGSCSPVTQRQIDAALEAGFAAVALPAPHLFENPPAAESAIARAIEAAGEDLESRPGVIVHSARGPDDPLIAAVRNRLLEQGAGGHDALRRSSEVIGRALGRILRGLLERHPLQRAVVAGGDTAGYAARELGIQALEMLSPLAPGSPLCRARARASPADSIEICFKGGQVGAADFFSRVAQGRPYDEPHEGKDLR